MISPEKIARINQLARLAKEPAGLTPEQKAEQASLRREYIDAVKASLQPQLESIRFVDDSGQVYNPQTGRVEGFVSEDPRGEGA
ncbi:MAG: DUF896 domain-containing protein [Candidatus Sericytochromatia bacterium]|nr:DUF896 domain-containing protein [Candidatus Sericytochromatia bacterium]